MSIIPSHPPVRSCGVVQVPLTGDFITENANFSSFPLAFLTLIRMVTGENWNGLMHECDSYSTRATTYFCSFIILMSYVMLNLFIATMLENFQVASSSHTTQPSTTVLHTPHRSFMRYESIDPCCAYVSS